MVSWAADNGMVVYSSVQQMVGIAPATGEVQWKVSVPGVDALPWLPLGVVAAGPWAYSVFANLTVWTEGDLIANHLAVAVVHAADGVLVKVVHLAVTRSQVATSGVQQLVVVDPAAPDVLYLCDNEGFGTDPSSGFFAFNVTSEARVWTNASSIGPDGSAIKGNPTLDTAAKILYAFELQRTGNRFDDSPELNVFALAVTSDTGSGIASATTAMIEDPYSYSVMTAVPPFSTASAPRMLSLSNSNGGPATSTSVTLWSGTAGDVVWSVTPTNDTDDEITACGVSTLSGGVGGAVYYSTSACGRGFGATVAALNVTTGATMWSYDSLTGASDSLQVYCNVVAGFGRMLVCAKNHTDPYWSTMTLIALSDSDN